MHCSGDPLLCPIRAWAAAVMRILSYPGTSTTTYVNAYLTTGGNLGYLTGNQARASLCLAAGRIGANRLGFNPEEISTHSIRSGSAMACLPHHAHRSLEQRRLPSLHSSRSLAQASPPKCSSQTSSLPYPGSHPRIPASAATSTTSLDGV
jgi:hypothetical protein